MGLISLDWTKLDRTKAAAIVGEAMDLVEPVVVTPGNVDKYAFDSLKAILQRAITGGGMVVNAGPPQAPAAFLAGFQNVPAASVAFVNAHPEVIGRMTATKHNGQAWYSHAEQQAMLEGVGGIDWLSLLLTLAPIIIKIMLALFL